MSRGAHFDNDGQVSVKTVPASSPGKKDNRTINWWWPQLQSRARSVGDKLGAELQSKHLETHSSWAETLCVFLIIFKKTCIFYVFLFHFFSSDLFLLYFHTSCFGHFLKSVFSPQEFERHFYSEGLTNYSPCPGCLVLQIMYDWKTAVPVYLRIITAAFTLQRQNWIVVTEIIWPTKLKIFTVWPFIGKIDPSLFCSVPRAGLSSSGPRW